MADAIELTAEIRKDFGTQKSRNMRRLADRTPAILYGGKKKPVALSFAHNKLLKALEDESFFSSIINLDIAGKQEPVVVKALQRHPYKPKLIHIDLQRVSADKPITMQIPIHFLGEEEAPGVKEGGVVSRNMTEVEVKCLPKDLPEFFEIDLSEVELDQAVHLSELKLPEGVSLTVDIEDAEHDLTIASIHIPKVAPIEEETAEGEGEEGEEDTEGDDKEKDSEKAKDTNKGDDAKDNAQSDDGKSKEAPKDDQSSNKD